MEKLRKLKIAETLGIPFQELKPKIVKKDQYNKLLYVASTNKGLRENNEDYYKVSIHPQDPNLIMALVADGVGGYAAGEIASFYVAERLNQFFISLAPEEINDSNPFILKLKKEFEKINQEMLNNASYLGVTTLSCAFITKDHLIIAQIGDTRIYTYNQTLTQITDDESEVWPFYQDGLILKDDIRFISGNNVITNAIGDALYLPAKIRVLTNNAIQALLLTTDGITDILSEKTLNQLFHQYFLKDPEKVIEQIIQLSIYGNQETITDEIEERILLANQYSLYETKPGKDNATAVLTILPNYRKKY